MTAPGRIVVIGASAGGVEALQALLGDLPASLDAAVLVVQHVRAGSGEHLLQILQRRSAMRVDWAEDRRELERGHVYLAPPDVHLIIDGRRMKLVPGPRENHARPSINRLFRSAAAYHDARVIGVLLTGLLDDGSAGLLAIRRCGGVVLVQDPRDAAFPPMPRNAIEAVPPDAVLPLVELGPSIGRLVEIPLAPFDVPRDVALEAELDETGRVDIEAMGALGPQAPIACPECGAPTWRAGGSTSLSYRCLIGHVASAHTLVSDKDSEVERAMWSTIRAFEERGITLGHLAHDAARTGSPAAAEYRAQSLEAHDDARRVRAMLYELRVMREPEEPKPARPPQRELRPLDEEV